MSLYRGYFVPDGMDPTGMSNTSNFRVRGTGHHIVPCQIWDLFGFPPEAKKVFDDATIAVKGKHGGTGHGIKTGYTGHVKDLVAKKLQSLGVAGKKLTAQEYVDVAQDIVKSVRNSRNRYIRGFNQKVSNPNVLRKWVDNVGKGLPRPKGLTAAKFTGFRRVKVPRLCKFGRKVPVAKYVFLVGVTYLWNADYNNARADGYSPWQAGSIATARAADPGVEMAWDFGYGVGSSIGGGN